MNYIGGLVAAWTAMNMRNKNKKEVKMNLTFVKYWLLFCLGFLITLLMLSSCQTSEYKYAKTEKYGVFITKSEDKFDYTYCTYYLFNKDSSQLYCFNKDSILTDSFIGIKDHTIVIKRINLTYNNKQR